VEPQTKNPDGLGFGQRESGNEVKRRKVVFGAVLAIGVASLVFGTVAFFQLLRSPFAAPETNTNVSDALAQSTSGTLEELRVKDTDEDGLNDYDELYVYRTSPYLKDSDSDGATDAGEIQNSTDPNCPTGVDCFQTAISNTNSATATNAASQTPVSIEALRQSLRDAGAPEATLNAMSDEELLQMYNEIVAEDQGTSTNTNTGVGSDLLTNDGSVDAVSQLQTLQNLSAADIRSFLEQSGVDKATLDAVDDATLKATFDEALAQELSQ